MINLFRKPQTEVEAAQGAVDRAQSKHADLLTQLNDCEKELSALKAAAIDSCMERGRLDDFGNDEIAAASAGVATLTSAVAKAALALQEAQAAFTAAQDPEARAKSIATINNIIENTDRDGQAFLAALAAYITALKPAAAINPDCAGLLAFLEQASVEVPPAAAAALVALQHQARSIEMRSLSPRLPSPEPAPVSKAAINNVPATKRLCCSIPADGSMLDQD